MEQTIYPCFACEFESDSFDSIEAHITEKHSKQVQEDTAKVFEFLNKKYEKQGLQQIRFIPARFLINKGQNKIISGYDPDFRRYYIIAEPDVQVKDLQTLRGYKLVGQTEKEFILTKKR